MRSLITTNITTSIAMPVKSGTLDHIQLAYKEAIGEAIKGLIGSAYNSAIVYILNGLVNSGSGSNFIISAGSVFYNGEVYLVDAATFTAGGGNTAVGVLDTTFFTGVNADGVEFTDGIVRNVHAIVKMKMQSGLIGSGVANLYDMPRISSNIPQLNLGYSGIATVTGTYPNLIINVPAPPTPGSVILQSGFIPIGDLNTTGDLDANTALLSGSSNGISGYLYTFATPPGTSNYYAVVQLHNNGITTVAEESVNVNCVIHLGQCTSTQMRFFISTSSTSNTQDLWVRYILFAL